MTNWYVRPSGGGGGGTTWTNAWNNLGGINWASIAAGDSIWVAGGNYTQDLSPAATGTPGSRVYVRRARSDASECTGAAGWSAGYDLTVRMVACTINFGSSSQYVTVSGRTTSDGGSYGWFIDFTGRTSGTGISGDGNPQYCTAEYMDLQGPGYITVSDDTRGVDFTPAEGSTAIGNCISHAKIWDWESGIYNTVLDGSIFEWIEMYNIGCVNAATFHPNGIFISYGANSGTVRYCWFHQGPESRTNGVGEGIFFEQSGAASGWKIYGNVFSHLEDMRSIQITSMQTNLKIYNNSFFNAYPAIQIRDDQGGGVAGSSETRNNIFLNSAHDTCGTESHNLSQASPDPFVDSANDDFHIKSNSGAGYPRDAGTALAAEYATDPDGVTRGADGTWDIGAYEYASSPTPPTGVLALFLR